MCCSGLRRTGSGVLAPIGLVASHEDGCRRRYDGGGDWSGVMRQSREDAASVEVVVGEQCVLVCEQKMANSYYYRFQLTHIAVAILISEARVASGTACVVQKVSLAVKVSFDHYSLAFVEVIVVVRCLEYSQNMMLGSR